MLSVHASSHHLHFSVGVGLTYIHSTILQVLECGLVCVLEVGHRLLAEFLGYLLCYRRKSTSTRFDVEGGEFDMRWIGSGVEATAQRLQ